MLHISNHLSVLYIIIFIGGRCFAYSFKLSHWCIFIDNHSVLLCIILGSLCPWINLQLYWQHANYVFLCVKKGEKYKSLKTNCMPLDPYTRVQKAVNWFWLILYSKHTNKNPGFFMLFKTIEKHIIMTKTREMYIMYTTHFYIYIYIKWWWFFFQMSLRLPKQHAYVIKTFTIYMYTHNSEPINKLTIIFCTFDTYSRHRKVPSTVQYLLKTRTLHLKLQDTLHSMT